MVIEKKYKSCKHVPCGMAPSTHNGCKPKYCYSEKRKVGSAKHWSSCNMKNWFAKGTPRHTYQSSFCKKPMKVKKVRSKPGKYQVDVMTLHNKMPYIWRFLPPKIQKRMVVLAMLPKRIINTFPGSKDDKYIRRTKLVQKHMKKEKC